MNPTAAAHPLVRSRSGPPAFPFAARMGGLRPSAIREILKVTESPEVISFAGGLPAPELFPVAEVARAAAELFARDGIAALQYGTTEGFAPLREWLVPYLRAAAGLATPARRLLITHGSQQGLDLVAKVMLDPGDIVLTQNPGYLGALQVFAAYQAQVVGLASDEDGLRVDALEAYLSSGAPRPKFLYLIPNFQNPTGTTLSAARRTEVARLAAAYDLMVVEDDPYGRLRFSGAAAPALCSLPDLARWVYLGSTSKMLAPGLRVAWLAASDDRLFEQLVTAKQTADLHTSSLTQRLAWEWLRVPGTLDAHLVRLNAAYAARCQRMLAALAVELPVGCSWTRPEGGLFLWVTLPERIDAAQILQRCAETRVAFVPGEPFWVGPPRRNTLRLNFSNASPERIDEGVARLGGAVCAALAG